MYCFFFNDTATTEIYTLSLHDALPIWRLGGEQALHMAEHTLDRMAAGGIHDQLGGGFARYAVDGHWLVPHLDRKSTRLNSSHAHISYAVFCFEKKKATPRPTSTYHQPT